ncbi:hypothetical protein BO86DRAFT_460235 [Aspergillus japonicus CBS 114.51]|uniref:Uncharacterized protein n=1 Tax=Aspergillus japonicus CBS 114.51 TaxID=1448312 RepID=A0A8T8WJP5_ASPJA|nr:hypothetical protein BO86DRAFT_460235 [Aspergillus japonicus CBS 114.51]RAH75933.1 hypothetical protein BO86DRAFT_460235 [Aspergillus japonicus CBS 114.51]
MTLLWEDPLIASQDESSGDEFDPLEDNVVHFMDRALATIFASPEERGLQRRFRKHLHGMCDEAWAALLLIPLANLHTIEFTHECSSHLVSPILLKAAQHQPPFHNPGRLPFPHLHEVRANCAWGDSYIYESLLTPFFYFPAVRRISGSFIREDGGIMNLPLPIHRTACSVKEIAIQKVYSSDTILRWLEASSDLEHVAFQLSVHRDDGWTDFDASEFRKALLLSRQTLKTLRLEVDEYFDKAVTNYQDDNEEPFGAFTDFTILQDLVIRHAHLTGQPSATAVQDIPQFLVKMLPVCLKRLTVKDIMVDDLSDLLVMLLGLVQHRDLFCQLEQITLCPGWLDDDLIRPLRVASEAVGISLSVLDDDDYSYD